MNAFARAATSQHARGFQLPGPLGAFADARSVASLERKMARRGYLDGADMARTFNALRANDLIWNYVGSNWLMGEDPRVRHLAWNDDSTRMPATMHSFYLRSCYVGNEFARGELELAGARLSPAGIEADLYVLAAEADHIAPWRSSFEAVRLLFQQRRALRAHVVRAHRRHREPAQPQERTLDRRRADERSEHWLATATRRDGSWWEDWAAWIATRAGSRIEPPSLGSEMHPPLGDAPGEYVHEK